MNEKVAKAVANINRRLRVLRKAMQEMVESHIDSASVSSGGAGSSYKNASLDDLRQAIADLENAKQMLLNNGRRQCISPNFMP